MKKILRIILCTLGLAALLVLSSLLGIRIERNRQTSLELQKEHVSTIAVVNMDDGVAVDNEHVNYASKLISFPNDRFLVTGLADAKAGIENGTYAAYVIIPETFSTSVTSIENDPRKVTLVYQYNNKLTEEAKIQAVNDVNTFIALFNSNVAYMYMDAIMAEFHRVQDDSSTILANDNMEMEKLAGVDASNLIAPAQPVEDVSVNNDIEPVELTTYTDRNYDLLDDMLTDYSEAVQTGKDDFALIQEENTGVKTATDNFFQTYDTVIQDTVAGQSELLTTGKDELAEAVGIYNQDVEAQETEIRTMIAGIIDMQLEADKISVESQLQDIINEVESSVDTGTVSNRKLKDLQQQWETAYQNIQTEADGILTQKTTECSDNIKGLINDVYIQGYNDALDDLSGQIDSLKSDVDSENIAVSGLQSTMNGLRLSSPLPAETEARLENFKSSAAGQLSGMAIDWDQLQTETPELPETGNTEGGGESGGEASGSSGSGETEDSGDGGSGNDGAGGGESGGGNPEDEYVITLTAFDDEEAINTTVTDTLDLFKLESESEQINEVIQTYFVDSLAEESEKQMGILAEEKLLLNQSIDDYEALLVGYDPMQYIENADLGTYVNDMGTNAGEMMGAVEQNNSDYMSYAAEMYTSTAEHTTQVRNSLDEANTQTVENVEDCIGGLIESRAEINSQNVDILGEFPLALWYTRVGSQGNAEAYDCIVNPVVSQENGQAVANTAGPETKRDNSIKTWLVIVIGIGILFFLIETVISFRQQYKESEEESEEAM